MKILWAFLIFINFLLFLDWLIFIKTGYYILIAKPHSQLAVIFIDIAFFYTVIVILIYLCRSILFLRRIQTQKKKIISCFLFIALLLYIWYGFQFWIGSRLNFSDPANTTLYSSPSLQKELMFSKSCFLINCLTEAYEIRGIFKRRAYLNRTSGAYSNLKFEDFRNKYLNAFHDTSNIKLIWNQDETIVKWEVEVESEKLEGVVYLYK